jgi:hypothetical protein
MNQLNFLKKKKKNQLGFFRTKRDYYCVEQIALSVCVRLKIYWSSGYLKSCFFFFITSFFLFDIYFDSP